MFPSLRPPLIREAANLCHRLVSARWTLRPLLTKGFVGKQYRPVPPGIEFSQGLNLLHLEELQRGCSPGDNESATIDETAAYAEESLREGLRLNLDYMETVSQNISRLQEVIKQANTSVHDGHSFERRDGLLLEGVEALKRALLEKIGRRVAIRAHVHFLQFCIWLKNQEETGSVEERLFWERRFLGVHVLVRGEVEGALRAVADVEESHP